MARGLKVLGLTGGIGAGKSTVAGMIAARGVPVLDADLLAREVVAPGQPALAEIAAAWPEVIGADGASTASASATSSSPIPPRAPAWRPSCTRASRALAEARLAALAARPPRWRSTRRRCWSRAGRHRDFDGRHRRHRVARDAARARPRPRRPDRARRRRRASGAQAPLADKLRVATHVIDNDGDRATTEAQVDRLLASLGHPG